MSRFSRICVTEPLDEILAETVGIPFPAHRVELACLALDEMPCSRTALDHGNEL